MEARTNTSCQVECYQRAIKLDQYLAVAYFQQGVSNFLLGDFEEALANFNDTLLYLRGNTMIDYAQLGLLFKLYSCEVLFNRGLCYIYLQQKDAGMQDLAYAVKEKVVEDHNVIDEAIREEAEVRTVQCWVCLTCANLSPGLHCFLNTRRRRLPPQRSQSTKPQDEGLPRKGPASRGLGPCQRIHRLCRLRDTECGEDGDQGRPPSRQHLVRGDQPGQARPTEQETAIRTPRKPPGVPTHTTARERQRIRFRSQSGRLGTQRPETHASQTQYRQSTAEREV